MESKFYGKGLVVAVKPVSWEAAIATTTVSMMPFFLTSVLAQASPAPTPTPTPQEFVVPQEVRVLPGKLDSILMFNSNSPELVQEEGGFCSPPFRLRA
ncbi:DUF3370 family protein [Leptothermofonsia sp. ETS-13]|uniref:DUF3370 family protein n=1 Tax=Leptothermofonsia sp. ETS-13 TaxID=3035696 RepID=UPI003BA1F11C